jgi:hypothetical protein
VTASPFECLHGVVTDGEAGSCSGDCVMLEPLCRSTLQQSGLAILTNIIHCLL